MPKPKPRPEQLDRHTAVQELRVCPILRRIWLHGDMTPEKATWLMIELDILAAESQQAIHISLFTRGGDVEAGFAIYDSIRACAAPVDVLGTGEVFSAGVIILQAARSRLLTPSAHVLVHPVKVIPVSVEHDEAGMKAQTKDLRMYLGQMQQALVARGVRPRVAAKLCRGESYLSAQDAVKLGVADKILEPAAI